MNFIVRSLEDIDFGTLPAGELDRLDMFACRSNRKDGMVLADPKNLFLRKQNVLFRDAGGKSS